MTSLRRSPALVVSGLFLVVLVAMVASTRHLTDGLFVYPLDDSYIHLALARTLASHHTWGLHAGEFASASSSPGWTLLLTATDLVFGAHLLTPLVLNAILVVALLFALDTGLCLLRPGAHLALRYALLLTVLFASPITNLAFIGMEHVAQTLSILLTVLFAARLLSLPPGARLPTGETAALLAAAAAAGAFRYEAVFAVLPITLLLLLRRRVALAVLFAASSALGPLAFGLYSHHLSGFWLPFSVMMKSTINLPPKMNPVRRFLFLSAGGTFRPVLVLPLLLWLLRRRFHRFWSPSQIALLLSSTITAAHLALAPTRWLMRYEAYFIALFLFVFYVALPHISSLTELTARLRLLVPIDKAIAAALALVALSLSPFLVYRSWVGVVRGPRASLDRFDEHIQMARFVAQFYNHDTVVANDVGAIAFYTSAHLLDPVGLASDRPVRDLRGGHPISSDDLAAWAAAEHASIAVLQPTWTYIRPLIPAAWTPVGSWTLARNLVFGDLVVGFYAADPQAVPRLCQSLEQYSLPHRVHLVLAPGVCQAQPSHSRPE